jgi:hypothetical protein
MRSSNNQTTTNNNNNSANRLTLRVGGEGRASEGVVHKHVLLCGEVEKPRAAGHVGDSAAPDGRCRHLTHNRPTRQWHANVTPTKQTERTKPPSKKWP